MEHQELNIQVYFREDGTSPYYEWFDTIKDKKTKARILVRIDKLACGHFGDYKSVGEGVLELRLAFGPGFRIYFCLNGNQILILLMGGDKTSQYKDIILAKKLYIEFKERQKGEIV